MSRTSFKPDCPSPSSTHALALPLSRLLTTFP